MSSPTQFFGLWRVVKVLHTQHKKQHQLPKELLQGDGAGDSEHGMVKQNACGMWHVAWRIQHLQPFSILQLEIMMLLCQPNPYYESEEGPGMAPDPPKMTPKMNTFPWNKRGDRCTKMHFWWPMHLSPRIYFWS
uniref:Uncharacterized protein n=1 Tax=Eutreptiella gymnastica TaxID=73025 RepID=A0A7S4CBV4_9EUGL